MVSFSIQFQDCPSIHDQDTDSSPWILMTSYAVAATGLVIAVLLVAVSYVASTRHSKSSQSTNRSKSTNSQEDNNIEEPEETLPSQPENNAAKKSPLRQADPLHSVNEEEQPDNASIDSFLQLDQESVLSLYIEDSLTNNNGMMHQESLLGYNLQPTPSTPPRTNKEHHKIFCKQEAHQDSMEDAITQNMTQSFDSEEKAANNQQASKEYQRSWHTNNHTSMITLLAIYFVLHSSSFVLSGFDQVPVLVWQGTELAAASCLFAVALIQYTILLNPSIQQAQQNPAQRTFCFFWICSAFILVGAVTSLLLFAPTIWMRLFSGLGHFAIALMALFSICFGSKRNLRLLYLVDVFSMGFFIGGLVIRSSSWDCHGTLSSDLEAEAVFNLCSLLSIFCFGCSQIAQMLLQGHSSEPLNQSSQQETPSQSKRASTVVNTILDQDFTMEV